MCHNPQTNKSGVMYACGKCTDCHNKYIQHWVFRLQMQQKQTHDCIFLTLTYDYSHIPFYKGKFTLHKKDYQDFLKRLRKALPYRKIKYVLCGEYGENKGRPHYHAIIFDVTQRDFNTINQAWGKGQIHLGTVTPASIAYTFKYAVKGDIKQRDWRQKKPFIAMSKGIGEEWAFEISYTSINGIDKNGKNFVRYSKNRIAKPHFAQKLQSLLQMPYYVIPSSAGGTVKMSVPKFYLRAANYDTSQLGELYKDVIDKKYSSTPLALKDHIFKMQGIQRKYAVNQQTLDRQYTISKEKL